MLRYLLCFAIGLSLVGANAQPYIEGGNTRYRFAQTILGLDFTYTPNTGYSHFRNAEGQIERFGWSPQFGTMVDISGIHFWGHVEFNIKISLTDLKLGNTSYNDYTFRRLSTSGIKIFPLRLKENRPSPFAAIAIGNMLYRQGEGTELRRTEYPVSFGVTLPTRYGVLDLGANFYYNAKHKTYIDRDTKVEFGIPKWNIEFAYRYAFDITKTQEKQVEAGMIEKRLKFKREKKRLNDFSLAVGISFSTIVGRSSYNKEQRPYLDQHRIAPAVVDLGLGYYFHDFDAHLNIAWRQMKTKLKAYGAAQTITRKALTFEAYKFLFDYHGFVPFLGIAGSYENLHFLETDNGELVHDRTRKFWTPGVTFGWDIRPDKDFWIVLRGNLRYFPLLRMGMPGDTKMNISQIEFDFIQITWYPGRMAAALKVNKEEKLNSK